MKRFVLAGGMGTKLDPITIRINKQLWLEYDYILAEKYNLLEFGVNHFENAITRKCH